MLVPEFEHTETLCGDGMIHRGIYRIAAEAIKAFNSIPYVVIWHSLSSSDECNMFLNLYTFSKDNAELLLTTLDDVMSTL